MLRAVALCRILLQYMMAGHMRGNEDRRVMPFHGYQEGSTVGDGSKRVKTKYVGVYQRTATERMHLGKPDVCFDIAYKQGQRKVWEKVGWRSEGYSAAMAAQIRGERVRSARHADVVPQRQIVLLMDDAWAAYFRDHLAARPSAAFSQSLYSCHVQPALGRRALHDLGQLDISRLRRDIEARGLSAQTVRHSLALVRRIMRRCLDWGLWSGPMPRIELPRADNARYRFLSHDEAMRLLDALEVRSHAVRAIAEISLRTGMRLDEVLGLKGQSLDFVTRTIHVEGKGGIWRTVHMDQAVAALMLERNLSPDQHVFQDRAGGKIDDLSKTFVRTVEALGLNHGVTDRRARVVFHTLRHTFASWLAIDGVPLLTIGALLGHTSPKMTARYAHLCPKGVRDAAFRIDQIMSAHRS